MYGHASLVLSLFGERRVMLSYPSAQRPARYRPGRCMSNCSSEDAARGRAGFNMHRVANNTVSYIRPLPGVHVKLEASLTRKRAHGRDVPVMTRLKFLVLYFSL